MLKGMRSVLGERAVISSYDLVLVVTDHTNIEWELLVEAAQLIVDTRNIRQRVGKDHHKIFHA